MKIKSFLICCAVAFTAFAIPQEGQTKTSKGCTPFGIPGALNFCKTIMCGLPSSATASLGASGEQGCKPGEKPCFCGE